MPVLDALFCGDFAPCHRYEPIIKSNGSAVFGDLRNPIGSMDITFLNLEVPLCSKSQPIEKIGPNLRAHPDCIRAVCDAGFDIVGLANNHMMDHGPVGLLETMEVCKRANLLVCGAGKNIEEAQRSLVVERRGIRVALIAVAEHEFSIASTDQPGVAPLDPIDTTLQIEKARETADLLFVTIHGGNEYFPLPRPGLRKICRYFIDRGADAVICHHAHVPGAFELYRDKPIIYSLGNLIFDHTQPPPGWNEGYAVHFRHDSGTKRLIDLTILPYTQSVETGGVRLIQGEEKEAFIARIETYKRVLGNDTEYHQQWMEFVTSHRRQIILNMFSPILFRGIGRLSRFFPLDKMMLMRSRRLSRLNIVRCQSHAELLQQVLEHT
jgi:poly-gamma-glutamate synthesis protein (capsule biosynthesis protein)